MHHYLLLLMMHLFHLLLFHQHYFDHLSFIVMEYYCPHLLMASLFDSLSYNLVLSLLFQFYLSVMWGLVYLFINRHFISIFIWSLNYEKVKYKIKITYHFFIEIIWILLLIFLNLYFTFFLWLMELVWIDLIVLNLFVLHICVI